MAIRIPIERSPQLIRPAAVAGSFYPGGESALRRDVSSHLGKRLFDRAPIAAMAPHAGYVYSGDTAGCLYGGITIPPRIVLIGPNHTGRGRRAAVSPDEFWQTPLGRVAVDLAFRDELLREAPLLLLDPEAHAREHSLEVQLPFLQVARPKFTIVPIILGPLSLPEAEEMGRALARVIRHIPGETMILASSDMNHYESQSTTIEKDRIALHRFLELDPAALYRDVEAFDISMCGFIPATVALVAAHELGAASAELLDHRTSGDVSGDYDQVVGYASSVVM